jgi:hypothetical protein
MPAFNAAPYIFAAVQSIQRQTWHDWELIAVDDASTDGTARILQAFAAADDRIIVHQSPSNRGTAAALNQALMLAGGRFIARMDADDIAVPDRLILQLQSMRQRPEVHVLGGLAFHFNSAGVLGLIVRPETHEALVADIFRKCPFIHPSVMVRREFYEALGGYDARLRKCQDRDLWLRGYKRFRYHNLQEPLIYYRLDDKYRVRAGLLSATFNARVVGRALRRERRLDLWVACRPWAAIPVDMIRMKRLDQRQRSMTPSGR